MISATNSRMVEAFLNNCRMPAYRIRELNEMVSDPVYFREGGPGSGGRFWVEGGRGVLK